MFASLALTFMCALALVNAQNRVLRGDLIVLDPRESGQGVVVVPQGRNDPAFVAVSQADVNLATSAMNAQFGNRRSLAVDQATGDIYITEQTQDMIVKRDFLTGDITEHVNRAALLTALSLGGGIVPTAVAVDKVTGKGYVMVNHGNVASLLSFDLTTPNSVTLVIAGSALADNTVDGNGQPMNAVSLAVDNDVAYILNAPASGSEAIIKVTGLDGTPVPSNLFTQGGNPDLDTYITLSPDGLNVVTALNDAGNNDDSNILSIPIDGTTPSVLMNGDRLHDVVKNTLAVPDVGNNDVFLQGGLTFDDDGNILVLEVNTDAVLRIDRRSFSDAAGGDPPLVDVAVPRDVFTAAGVDLGDGGRSNEVPMTRFAGHSLPDAVAENDAAAFDTTLVENDELSVDFPMPPGFVGTVTVDFGDVFAGANVQSVPVDGEPTLTLTHTYHDDFPSQSSSDTYTVRVSFVDSRGVPASTTFQVTVTNAAPTVSNIAVVDTVPPSETVTVTFDSADVGLHDEHRGFVDFGDGSAPVEATLLASDTTSGVKSWTATHTYPDPDPTATDTRAFTATPIVRDDDLGASTLASPPTATPTSTYLGFDPELALTARFVRFSQADRSDRSSGDDDDDGSSAGTFSLARADVQHVFSAGPVSSSLSSADDGIVAEFEVTARVGSTRGIDTRNVNVVVSVDDGVFLNGATRFTTTDETVRTFALAELNTGDVFQRRIYVLTTGRRFTSTLFTAQLDTSGTSTCVEDAAPCNKEYRGADNIEQIVSLARE